MANSRAKKRNPARKPATPVENARAELHHRMLDLVRQKLTETNNRSQIAAELGMSRRNLYRYLSELGVTAVEPVLVSDDAGGFNAEVRAKR